MFGDPTAVSRSRLADGDAGTDQTIYKMAQVAMGPMGAGSTEIRALALKIVNDAGIQQRDQEGEVVAIHNWVMRHLRYVRDPLGYELITYPETLAFQSNNGDCDDHVILETALLGSLGIPSHFIVIALNNAPVYSHVYMAAEVKGYLIPLDPIKKDEPAGWEAPDPTAKKIYPISTPSGVDLSGAIVTGRLAGIGLGTITDTRAAGHALRSRARFRSRNLSSLTGLGFLIQFLRRL
jgi:predicted transglutaminase-like cysteine proteinase